MSLLETVDGFLALQTHISQPTRNTETNTTIQDNQITPAAQEEAEMAASFDKPPRLPH